METETVTRTEYLAMVKAARDRRGNGPVRIKEMTDAEREGFKLSLAEIRRRGMYGR